MKRTKLTLRRTTITTLVSRQLGRAAGGRWHDPGPSEEAGCASLRYCTSEPTAECTLTCGCSGLCVTDD